MKRLVLQNSSVCATRPTLPTCWIVEGDDGWDQAYEQWRIGKNPSDNPEWKKGCYLHYYGLLRYWLDTTSAGAYRFEFRDGSQLHLLAAARWKIVPNGTEPKSNECTVRQAAWPTLMTHQVGTNPSLNSLDEQLIERGYRLSDFVLENRYCPPRPLSKKS